MALNLISKKIAEHYVWGNVCDGWHLVKSDEMSIIQERMPPGAFEVKHYHTKAWQFFYVLSGVATLEADGAVHVLHSQEGIEIPPNTPHQLRNESAADVHFIVVSKPSSHGDRIIVS